MPEPVITITIKANGNVQLQANIDNQLVIYGALEMAKDAVRMSFQKAAGNGIVAAPAEALSQLQATGK